MLKLIKQYLLFLSSEVKIPPKESLLNETYHVGMETLLEMWWRQRRHISKVDYLRTNISVGLQDNIKIEPFDDLLNSTMSFIGQEIMVIQDIIWGERSTLLFQFTDQRYKPAWVEIAN